MKISHTKLETAINNPSQFVKDFGGTYQGGKSRYRYWQYAVNHFHKPGEDRDSAVRHLNKLFDSFAQNATADRLKEMHIDHLDNYIRDYESLDNIPFKVTDKISFDIGYGNVISGEVHRVDLKIQGGYDVYVFMKGDEDWESQIRFPLLQLHYAQELGCELHEISVGVYSFALEKHYSTVFPEEDIRAAFNDVNELSQFIDSNK